MVSLFYCLTMLLSKQIAVILNLTECRFKQYLAYQLGKYELDLTPEQFLLLDTLWNMGKMTQQTMADTVGKDKNSITKLIDALERKGYVRREKAEDDRRANFIVTTQKAMDLRDHAKEKGIEALEIILDGISDDERRMLVSTLVKITDNINRQKNA